MLTKRFFSGCCGVILCLYASVGYAQQAPRIINQNQIDQSNRVPERRDDTTLPPTSGAKRQPSRTPSSGGRLIRLEHLSISGSTLSDETIETFWSRWQDRTLTANQLADVTNDLKQFYSDQDYALYAVDLVSHENGTLYFNILEGHIGEIEFVGDADIDLSLVRAYAAKVIADQPLRRSTFQRYLLLMGDIPGLSVDPVFLPLRPTEGVIKLEIALEKKPVELGLTYTNQGLGAVSRSQFDARVAFNSLFRQGDVTEIGYGFPDDFDRYRLISLFHEQAIGSEGTRLSIFHNDFQSTPNAFQEGNSRLTVIQAIHPLLRSKEKNAFLNVSLDHLDNENKIFDLLITDERTRVMRVGLSGDVNSENGNFTAGYLSLSKGFDAFGARQDFLFGKPDFLKGNMQLRREQALIGRFSARLRASIQYTPDSLPSSEQLFFGGADYGGAFEIARFSADRGALTAGEIIYRLNGRFSGRFVQQPELYGFADYGYLNNINASFLPENQRAASAGLGIRFGLFDRAYVQFQAGHPLETPDNFDPADKEWRYFFQIRSAF